MMTRRYLLSTTPSRSSIGGLVMPSAAGIPATVCLPLRGAFEKPMIGPLGQDQGYQLVADVLDGRVHQRHVEFRFGGEFHPGRGEPALHHFGRLRAPAGQPAHQFRPGRRREEHQERVRHGTANLPCTRQVDLKESRDPRRELLLDRCAGGAIPVARESGPFEELPAGQHRVKLRVADKVILTPVDFTGPRRPCGYGHREPDFRAFLAEARDDRALADTGRAGKHSQQCATAAPPDKRGTAWAMNGRIGRGPMSPTRYRVGDERTNRPWTHVPRARPWAPQAGSDTTAELILQGGALVSTQATHTARFGDAEPLHDLPGTYLADTWDGLEQSGDFHLSDDVIALAIFENLGQARGTVLEAVLDLGTLLPGSGRLL